MLGKNRMPKVGEFVEFSQSFRGELYWLPFLVTDVASDTIISGVAFTGFPARFSWGARGTQAYSNVSKGTGMSQVWRFKRGRPPKDETEEDPPADGQQQENGDG